MARIKELRPPAPVLPKTPRCYAMVCVTWPHAEKRGCSHSSNYEIDGKFYCTVHARQKALEIMLAE